jgi:hypothetical protein
LKLTPNRLAGIPLTGAEEATPGPPYSKKLPALWPPENMLSASVTLQLGGGDVVKSEVWRVI